MGLYRHILNHDVHVWHPVPKDRSLVRLFVWPLCCSLSVCGIDCDDWLSLLLCRWLWRFRMPLESWCALLLWITTLEGHRVVFVESLKAQCLLFMYLPALFLIAFEKSPRTYLRLLVTTSRPYSSKLKPLISGLLPQTNHQPTTKPQQNSVMGNCISAAAEEMQGDFHSHRDFNANIHGNAQKYETQESRRRIDWQLMKCPRCENSVSTIVRQRDTEYNQHCKSCTQRENMKVKRAWRTQRNRVAIAMKCKVYNILGASVW